MLRYAGRIALLLLLVPLSACDPASVPIDPAEVWVDVSVASRGTANATVRIGADAGADLTTTASAVSARLHPADPPEVRIDRNDPGGVPIASLAAIDVFTPGRRPTMDLAWDGLVGSLTQLGFSRIRVQLCVPSVPRTFAAEPRPSLDGSCASWELGQAGPDIAAVVRLHADPARFWRVVPFLVVGVLGTVVGAVLYRRSRRGRVNAAAAVALIAMLSVVAAFIAGVADLVDHMNVAGVQGPRVWVAGLGAPISVVSGVASMGIFASSMWGIPRPRA